MDESRRLAVSPEDEALITLGLLTAVEGDSSITQRSIARHLDIALGLANAYVKRCMRKGFIKVTAAPANRYAYYLTPRGFSEKSRLTAEYLRVSFNFFRGAREQCGLLLRECADREWRRVALVGVGDLAEIATLCATESPIELLGIVDPDAEVDSLAGYKVVGALGDLGEVDAVIITDFSNGQAAFERMVGVIGADRVLAPPLLNISRTPVRFAD